MKICQINIILTFSINKNIGAHFYARILASVDFLVPNGTSEASKLIKKFGWPSKLKIFAGQLWEVAITLGTKSKQIQKLGQMPFLFSDIKGASFGTEVAFTLHTQQPRFQKTTLLASNILYVKFVEQCFVEAVA